MFVLVFFENIFVYAGFVIVVLPVFLVFAWFLEKSIKKFFFYYPIVCLLALISVFGYNYYYFWDIPDFEDTIEEEIIIQEYLGNDRYTVKDTQGRKYQFVSENNYQVWEKLKTYSYYSPAFDECHICDISYKPLGDYEFDFSYEKYLFDQWYYGTIWENNSISKSIDKDNLWFFYHQRNNLKEYIKDIYWNNDYTGLTLGVLIWERSILSDSAYQDFIDTGLVHIIATSWTHVSFLILFLNIVFIWIPLYIRIPIMIPFVWFYAFLAGMEANIFRAFLMWSLALLAVLFGRSRNTWYFVSFAFFVILIINPYAIIHDMGFVLSFAALIGIILFQNIVDLGSKWFFVNIYNKYLHPTLGASLGVAPFLLFFDTSFNLLSILSNLFVLPLLPLLMILSFVVLIWDRVQIFHKLLINYFLDVAEFFANNWIYVVVNDILLSSFLVIVFLKLIIVYRIYF